MAFFERYKSIYWRNVAIRFTLILVTVALIVFFMPRNRGVQLRYDIGKPWMYGSFIAKFDFPVYKTDEAVKAEQDSALKSFQPYYNYDAKLEKSEIKQFYHDFSVGIEGMPSGSVHRIAERLHQLYRTGIMSTPEYNDLVADSSKMIRVVSGKEAKSTKVNMLYSTMSAYETILLDPALVPYRSILQRCNLTDYIAPNLSYDKKRCDAEKSDLLGSIPLASGMVMSGQKVIDRGEIVNDYTYRVLSSFEREMQRRNATEAEITNTLIGQILFVTILVTLFTIYLALFRDDYFLKPRSILMLYAMVFIFPILVSLMMSHSIFSVYVLPFTLVPIFVRVFMDSRTAFITHAVMILICAATVRYQYEFIIIQLVSGLIAIYSLRELSSRAQVFKTSLLVTVGSILVYISLQLLQSNDLLKLDRDMYVYFLVNGVLLLLSYPLMYLIEKAFGFVSNVTLIELSNTNRGLLRDLSEIAPGTFQHSITVGNLASEIANRIGANSLLVRTGALYHDIGKMTNPVFFTENQAGVNPHDHMSYEDSAKIIISHVTEGVKMAEKYNLPTIIKDFILTHHGRGVTKYFYIKYKNEHPDEDIDMEKFTYPGPNPFTREQAILMMADTVEAASRSLNEYTEESISQLVNKLIDGQVADGFFTECPITFRDISLAKQLIIARLMAIYHTRIQYPELKGASKS
ncbi:HDIG domain-containing metalloprotein [Segatella oris]|uniref:HD family phosphohydrolase n=1 Tax=Segatella oris TaxID=28135 RepID=UPI0028ECED2F|nr:HDIG domain-containing metalloprotein [Segatella oris]